MQASFFFMNSIIGNELRIAKYEDIQDFKFEFRISKLNVYFYIQTIKKGSNLPLIIFP